MSAQDVHAQVLALLRAEYGLDGERGGMSRTLARFLERRAGELGVDERGYLERLRADQGERSRMLHSVTVGHSWFYRDPGQLAEIRERLRAHLHEHSPPRPVRVWVAGCANGEEAWTIALIADALTCPVEILATDIDELGLERGRAGVYGAWALRELPEPLREDFEATGPDAWRITDRLRGRVTFMRHNLCDPPPRPETGRGWDMICCRNVLIYFERERAHAIVAGLRGSLDEGGQLFLGVGDLLFQLDEIEAVARARLPRQEDGADEPSAPSTARVGADEPGGDVVQRAAERLASGAVQAKAARPSSGAVEARSARPSSGVVHRAAERVASGAVQRGGIRTPSGVVQASTLRTPSGAVQARMAEISEAFELDEPLGPPAPPDPPSEEQLEQLCRAGEAVEAGDLEEAKALLETILDEDPTIAEGLLWLGVVHHLEGDAHAASEALRRACCMEPELWPATLFAALSAEHLGRWRAARRCWSELDRALRAAEPPRWIASEALSRALPRWRAEALELVRQRYESTS
ncbi:hypothetical protein G6O69_10415 [Pseudenhygromyxa sp. WMMC2535]|uniref:CheR family methyltransferase n=1 Tax=Pseudenhygromyxa sp. WMMC2535 TaxID=2712867 RepID=UPI001552139A|nr:protein-glutamate O-methyltransferase CheR [Pseudenhygromyxa sp. WMMC2535]NVB38244.1 hypothetical protein [Pseudenhygromyxa sp. WMMC2535]